MGGAAVAEGRGGGIFQAAGAGVRAAGTTATLIDVFLTVIRDHRRTGGAGDAWGFLRQGEE
jgi:hypothetical protein